MNKQNWWQLSSIQIGGAICLPVIILGSVLNQTYGFASAVAAVVIGNAILLLLGLISAKMSYEKNMTTAENAVEYFGEKGVSLFALTTAMALLGWFAIQVDIMSLGIVDLFSIDSGNGFSLILVKVILGVVITLVALYGLRGINILADISMPLLFLTLGYAMYSREERIIPATEPAFSFGGISLVIAMAMALVIDLPNYFRFAKSCKHGYISISIVFLFVVPFLEILGIYLAAGSSGEGILEVFKRQDGVLWNAWVAAFLVLAGWTTNNVNLYSGVVCLEFLWKGSNVLLTLLFGLFGTMLACCDLLKHFEIILDIMGVFISSMGAVVITRYFLSQFKGLSITARDQKLHFLAWGLGIVYGFSRMAFGGAASIPVLDAMMASSLGTVLFITPLFRSKAQSIQSKDLELSCVK